MTGSILVIGWQEFAPWEKHLAEKLREHGFSVDYLPVGEMVRTGAARRLGTLDWHLPHLGNEVFKRRRDGLINDRILTAWERTRPTLVLLYNDSLVLPETLKRMQQGGSRTVILAADNPNYVVEKRYFLLLALWADAVITFDTGWAEELRELDIKNVFYHPGAAAPEIHFPLEPTAAQKERYGCDLLFVGTGYGLHPHGVRRAAMLANLAGMNFKLFGNSLWHQLLPYFPQLRPHLIFQPLPAAELNVAHNCARIIPVVTNRGVLRGIPTRTFDALLSGVFPLAEYRSDYEQVFQNGEIALFRTGHELRRLAEYYLKHPDETRDMTNTARSLVLKKYTFQHFVDFLIDVLELK